MTPAAAPALLRRTDEIRSILRTLSHRQSRVYVCNALAEPDSDACESRILGPDWRLPHFFWRPEDIRHCPAHLRDLLPAGEILLDFSAVTPQGDEVRFRVARSMTVHFPDSSAALLSGFPDVVQYLPAERPVEA
ncbi:hypothetical protein CAL18_05890 [Bordetella genomosp. 7]|uniref:hypothetical protein n=1 Tax=Bordetella genomosp. 7 TaxID=1416805 RepID=UPI000B9E1114|nr:hypothetical protein [Bordetella genomosp. 7]OZI27067.1 hypothetical protein CAL18_05890 [Bordetella genomosp. 7]